MWDFFIKSLADFCKNRNFEPLEKLEALENLERLESLEALEERQIYNLFFAY